MATGSSAAKAEPLCVLALHGFGGNPRELEPMLERVRAVGFDVVAPLLPGHGTEPRDLQERRFDEWVAFAREGFDDARRRYDRVVVLGFSMGSLVAMSLAVERDVSGLVVLGNALHLSRPLRAAFGAFDLLKLRPPDLYVPKPRPADMEDQAAARALTNDDRHPLRAALEVHRAAAKLRHQVHRIQARTLILHGAKDRVCPVENATWLAAKIPHPTVRIYPRSAHVVAADYDRDAVSADVITFLREISAGR